MWTMGRLESRRFRMAHNLMTPSTPRFGIFSPFRDSSAPIRVFANSGPVWPTVVCETSGRFRLCQIRQRRDARGDQSEVSFDCGPHGIGWRGNAAHSLCRIPSKPRSADGQPPSPVADTSPDNLSSGTAPDAPGGADVDIQGVSLRNENAGSTSERIGPLRQNNPLACRRGNPFDGKSGEQ